MRPLTPERAGPDSIHLVGWGFILLGVIVAAIGLTWVTRTALFLKRAVKVPGEIVTVEETIGTRAGREDRFAGTTYKPVVAYTDHSGVRHQVKSTRSVRSDAFGTGDQVQVYYDPREPDQMFIDSPYVLWFAPGVISAMGIFFVLFVGGCFWLMGRNAR